MRKIYFSHDGSNDDFIGLLALMQMDDVEITGIGVMNADCYSEAGIRVTRKMIDRFCPYSIEVSESTARPVNQFTEAWRRFSYVIDAFPILCESGKMDAPFVEEPSHIHMINKIRENDEKTTIFALGPLTDIAKAIKDAPDILEKIEGLIWMGGSFTDKLSIERLKEDKIKRDAGLIITGTSGNIHEPNHDGTAEWNSFWDPFAVEEVLSYDFPITMVPLSATNQCRWHKSLGEKWARMRMYPAIDFVGQIYTIVTNLYEYFFWDSLTAAYFGNSSIATTRQLRCKVHTTGNSAGRIEETDEGKLITILDKVDHMATFDYLTELFKKPGVYQKVSEID